MTSLPGPYGNGDLGASAYHFIDWLIVAGQSLWQMLPLGPIGHANSPYMCLSAFAGNPLLIDLEDLQRQGWIDREMLAAAPSFSAERVEFDKVIPFRTTVLKAASARFFGRPGKLLTEFEAFRHDNRRWLADYALFQALNEAHGGVLWTNWEQDLVQRVPAALRTARTTLAEDIRRQEFVQWVFHRQWHALKKHANERGIRLIGDIPIFVSHHSADVWAHPELFYLDGRGAPTVVAGVPPDYFSETGQRWGNPLYRWDVMQQQRFRFWVDRFRASLDLFDILRVDHFRGFEAYWEIPGTEKTAVRGRWVKAPGEAMFRAVLRRLGKLPIIAEDLGVITPEVTALRDAFELPGMRVLQFAFAAGPENTFLPHNYQPHTVVYTGTHDNDTTAGWFATATEHEREFVRRYASANGENVARTLIRLALQSVADMCVVPFQDVLGLGAGHRMNFPGTVDRNWEWRFSWSSVQPHHADGLYALSALAGRTAPDRLHLPDYPTGKVQP